MVPPPLPEDPSGRDDASDASKAAAVIGVILLVILIPSWLVLRSVEQASMRQTFDTNPTPLGYTISLALYLVPTFILTVWFLRRHPRGSLRRRAVGLTLGLLIPIGFVLDLLFGNLFFIFPDPGATLQIYVPGYSFRTGGMVRDIPLEEFVFYIAGFCAVLLVYAWCDEVWLAAYDIADYDDKRLHPPYVIQLEWRAVYWGLGLIALAIIFKKTLAPINYRTGFPLYFVFLVVTSIVPSLLLFRTARPFVNWRALSMTLLWVLLTSVLWEATLASPYGWWRYQYEMMMGLHVKAWADLPVEAVLVWIAVSFTVAIVFETIKVALHIDKPWRQLLFGSRRS